MWTTSPHSISAQTGTSSTSSVPKKSSQTADLLTATDDPTSHSGGIHMNIAGDSTMVAQSYFIARSQSSVSNGGNLSEGKTIKPIMYTVESGDTLSSIAAQFDVKINTIKWSNDYGSVIHPGDTLVIPRFYINDTVAEKETNKLPKYDVGFQYTVQEGDTISKIAYQFDTSMQAIITYNNLKNNGIIVIGEEIMVPGGTKPVVPRMMTDNSSDHNVAGNQSTNSVSPDPSNPAPDYSSGGFHDPVPGAILTQGIHGHNAVDLAVPIGTQVHAAESGTVKIANQGGWNGGYGSYIVIDDPDGSETLYAHLHFVGVDVGEWVNADDVIGLSGDTGYTTGPHVHFETHGFPNPLRPPYCTLQAKCYYTGN